MTDKCKWSLHSLSEFGLVIKLLWKFSYCTIPENLSPTIHGSVLEGQC